MPKQIATTPYVVTRKRPSDFEQKASPSTAADSHKKSKKKEELLFDDQGLNHLSNAATTTEEMSPQSTFSLKKAYTSEKNEKPDMLITCSKILLLQSIFANGTMTIFCQYPKCCNQIRNTERATPMPEKKYKLKYKLAESACAYNCVIGSLKSAGFVATEGSNWNLLWSAPLQLEALKNFNKYQRCNHFPGCWELGRKDNLWKNISRYFLTLNMNFIV